LGQGAKKTNDDQTNAGWGEKRGTKLRSTYQKNF